MPTNYNCVWALPIWLCDKKFACYALGPKLDPRRGQKNYIAYLLLDQIDKTLLSAVYYARSVSTSADQDL